MMNNPQSLSLKEQKQQLRALFKAKRAALSIEERLSFSEIIFDTLLSSAMVESADIICSYASFGDEVSTVRINDAILSMNKTLLLPRIDGKRLMNMVEVNTVSSYEPNEFGILEPIGDPYQVHDNEAILCIMPLLAFDVLGHRLGYGGGYYDTFLSNHVHMHTIGIGFSCQFSEHPLPVESHDHSPDFIIDELGIRSFNKQ